MAGTGAATGRALERGRRAVSGCACGLVVPGIRGRRPRARRGERAQGQGGPGRARGRAQAGGAYQGGVQRGKAVLIRLRRGEPPALRLRVAADLRVAVLCVVALVVLVVPVELSGGLALGELVRAVAKGQISR